MFPFKFEINYIIFILFNLLKINNFQNKINLKIIKKKKLKKI